MTTGNAALQVVTNGAATPAAVEALSNAVIAEVRLLEDLIGVLRKQRSAVGSDDIEGVDDSVFATHRILVTLGEARRQRRSLGRLISGKDDVGLRDLDDILGDQMTEELRDASDGLRAAALILSREVEMNRKILRSALSVGGEMMRGLYAPENEAPTYAKPALHADGEGKAASLLLDRQV